MTFKVCTCRRTGTNVTLTGIEFGGCDGSPAVLIEGDGARLPVNSTANDTAACSGECGSTTAEFLHAHDFNDATPSRCDVRIIRCVFDGNRGNGSNGGAVSVTACDLRIEESSFTDNTANNGPGGAVLASSTRLTITESNFSRNSAGTNGGAIYIQADDSALMIARSIFQQNSCGPKEKDPNTGVQVRPPSRNMRV